jgi:hypothetical protein
MKLTDINIYDVGTNIQIAGAIYSDRDRVYLVPFPHGLTDEQRGALDDVERMERELKALDFAQVQRVNILDLTHEDWKVFLRQCDILEVEMLEQAEVDGQKKLVKAVIRKSARQIDQGVVWAVYKRDGYRCRYCGKEGIPMTVDHVVTWEMGGPSIEENLVTACRRDNKIRGNLPFDEWLRHPHYRKVSKNLIIAALEANEALVATLDSIPRRQSRKKR